MNLLDIDSFYDALRWGGPFLALAFLAVAVFVAYLIFQIRSLLYLGLGVGALHLLLVLYLFVMDSDQTSWFYLFSGALFHGIAALIMGFLQKESWLKRLGWGGITLGLLAGFVLEAL